MEHKSEIVKLAEQKVNLLDYFNTYVIGEVQIGNHCQMVTPVKIGGSTLCPFHAETDASFKVYESNGMLMFHCFGCGVHGTVVGLYRKVAAQSGVSLSQDESAKRLLRLYGYEQLATEALKDINPLSEALKKVRSYSVVETSPTFNIAMFRQQNDKIRGMQDVNQKVKQFAMLDRTLSAYASKDDSGVERS